MRKAVVAAPRSDLQQNRARDKRAEKTLRHTRKGVYKITLACRFEPPNKSLSTVQRRVGVLEKYALSRRLLVFLGGVNRVFRLCGGVGFGFRLHLFNGGFFVGCYLRLFLCFNRVQISVIVLHISPVVCVICANYMFIYSKSTL